MAHYGDEDGNSEDSVSTVFTDIEDQNMDSNDEKEYFDPKPRKINFDDLENEMDEQSGENDDEEDNFPKQKKRTSLGDGVTKKFSCDHCNKFFEKRWALNSHLLLHSGLVTFINSLSKTEI